ncbi:MAG: thiamine phosphate synthase [Oscillospiraceae bacterium]|nr:thiamine phosphate synthase [Oscillospiraceae bacterium]MDE6658113.1 thiamine phosphate synthase [Oscillospiraceae bacterium]
MITFKPEILQLYAVTDRRWLGTQTLVQQVESAIKGGVTCVQLREKNLDKKLFLQEALAIKKICNFYHVPLVINDNIEIACESGADGVHVGQNDMPVEKVRNILGKNKIIGVTVRTVEQALQAQSNGADYLGVGAIFSTGTKTDAIKTEKNIVKAICKSVKIPVIAIGGITQENILQLAGLGVQGVALVSAIFSASDIEQTCRKLKILSEQIAN